MTKTATLTAALILAAASPIARGQDAETISPEDSVGVDASLSLDRGSFGEPGSQYFGVLGAGGLSFESDDDSTDANLALTYHRFLIQDIEFIGELGGWYFNQSGNNAAGVNPAFTIRWHFLNRDRWTVYADAGMGLLFTTDNVPEGGTSFNFMPRVGAGGTVRLTDDGARLFLGARWHHVSNARIQGDDGNPDRDGVALYAGVMFPF